MPIIRRLSLAIVLLSAAACGNPRTEANVAQALQDAGSEMNSLKGDIAQLQQDMDSLRTVVAKQDSLLTRIATVTNVPK